MKKRHYFLFVLFFSIVTTYFYLDSSFFKQPEVLTTYVNEQKINEIEELTASDKIKSYQETLGNNDIIGKIKIEGTNIDNYLLQYTNNNYYLDHLLDHSYDKNGEIFLDYRNQVTDRKLLIYGHNFKSQSGKFHDLVKYVSKDFYLEHPYIELETTLGESKWQIFSVMIVTGKDYPHTILRFDDLKWIEHIIWMKQESLYDTGLEVNDDDYILTLQTCYYGGSSSNTFLIINAKKI